MNIGDVARASGLSTKTVRYYADIDLIAPPSRGANGYRQYGQNELQKLCFVRRARAFGFSLDECRELLSLYEDRSRASAEVKQIALERLAVIGARLRELEVLREELQLLASACDGDDRPDCPILAALAGEP